VFSQLTAWIRRADSNSVKKVAALIAVMLVSAPGASATRGNVAACSAPRTYDVVRVDPRFHISRSAFIALLERAERLWEVPTGRNLLQYEPGGEVHVSLVYDSRTAAYVAQQQSAKTIGSQDALLKQRRAALKAMQSDLDKRALELKTQKATLNKKVDYWNARGGAPANVIGEIRTEEDAINKLAAAFNLELVHEKNAEASFNALVSARNALAAHTAKGSVELGRARRGGTDMELFALSGDAAKDATLAAHEFGHILGLAHIPGADNIMNPYLVHALTRASAADLEALRRVCS
jgi:hypothetical protein